MTNRLQPTGTDGGSMGYLAQLERELQESKLALAEKERINQLQYALILQQVDELKKKQKLKEEMLVFFLLTQAFIITTHLALPTVISTNTA